MADHGGKGPHVVVEEALWHRGQQDEVADGMDPSEEEAEGHGHMDQHRDHVVVVVEERAVGGPGLGCAS